MTQQSSNMSYANISEFSLGISERFSSHFRGRKSRRKNPKVEKVEYDDNLTREESEERINILLLILAILNIISATTMSGYELEYQLITHQVNVNPYVPPIEINASRVPHILVTYPKGITLDYSLDTNISKPLNFGDLPDSRNYLAFFNEKSLYTTYIDDGNKGVTKWNGEKHRTITKSALKYPPKLKQYIAKYSFHQGWNVNFKELRVGKFHWVFGYEGAYCAECGEGYEANEVTFLWSFEREKWIDGPKLLLNGKKIKELRGTCVTNFNATHVLFYRYSFSDDINFNHDRLALFNVFLAKWTVLRDEEWIGFYELYNYLVIDGCDRLFTKTGQL